MKLHLPKGLRTALLACFAAFAGIGTTLTTATVTGGVFAISMASQAMADVYHVTTEAGTVSYTTIAADAANASISLEGGTLEVAAKTNASLPLEVKADSTINGTARVDGVHAGLTGAITTSEDGGGDLTINSNAKSVSDANAHGDYFALSADVDLGANNLIIASGVVRLGDVDESKPSNSYTLKAGNVVVKQGAYFEIYRNGGTLDTGITLEGGTLRVQQVNSSGSSNLKANSLTVSGEGVESVLSRNGWGKSLFFGALTGDGNLTLKDPGATAFDKVDGFTGTLKITGGKLDVNGGTIGGTLSVDGGTANVGSTTLSTVTQKGGTLEIKDGCVVDSLTVTGGTVKLSGTVVLKQAIASNGRLEYSGTLDISGMDLETLTPKIEEGGYSNGTSGYKIEGSYTTYTLVSGSGTVVSKGGTLKISDTETATLTSNGTFTIGELTTNNSVYYVNENLTYDDATMAAPSINVASDCALRVGNGPSAENAAVLGDVTLASGAKLIWHHKGVDNSDCDIVMSGGSIFHNEDSTESNTWGTLTSNGETANKIQYNWKGTHNFAALTGDADLTLVAHGTEVGSTSGQTSTGEARKTTIESLTDYNAKLTDEQTNGHKLYINGASQGDGKSATVAGSTYSDADGFTMVATGTEKTGSVTFEDMHTAEGDISLQSGTLAFQGGLTAAGKVSAQGGTLTLKGAVSATNGMEANGGKLVLDGATSESALTVTAGSAELKNTNTVGNMTVTGGAVTISGETTMGSMTVTGAALTFTGDVTADSVSISGAKAVDSQDITAGTVHMGNASDANAANTLTTDSITIAEGGRFTLYHAGDSADKKVFQSKDGGHTNLTLNGGTFYVQAIKDAPGSASVALGTLTVSGETSALDGTFGSHLLFDKMTGSGKLTIGASLENTNGWGNSVVKLASLTDFDGDIVLAEKKHNSLYINSVSQAENIDATVTGTTKSADGFAKSGKGSIALDTHNAEGSFTVSEGTLTVNTLSVAGETKLVGGTFGVTNDWTTTTKTTLGPVSLGTETHKGALTLAGDIEIIGTAINTGKLVLSGALTLGEAGLGALHGETLDDASSTENGYAGTRYYLVRGTEGSVLEFADGLTETTLGEYSVKAEGGSAYIDVTAGTYYVRTSADYSADEMGDASMVIISDDAALSLKGTQTLAETTLSAGHATLATAHEAEAASYTDVKVGPEGIAGTGEGAAAIGDAMIKVAGDYSIADVALAGSTIDVAAGALSLAGVTLGESSSLVMAAGSSIASGSSISLAKGSTINVADGVVLGSDGVNVTFLGTAINAGKLTLSGNVSVGENAQFDLVEGGSYTDGENGFAASNYYLVKGTEDGLTLVDGTMVGESKVGQDATGIYYQKLDGTTYHVNVGEVVYGSQGTTGATEYSLNGGTLKVDKGVNASTALVVTKDSTIWGSKDDGGRAGITGNITLGGDGGTLTIESNSTKVSDGGAHGDFFALSANVDLGTNDLIIASGVIRLGALDNDTVTNSHTLKAGNVVVKEGAAFEIYRNGGTLETGITLEGGTLRVQQVNNGGSAPLKAGTLTVSGEGKESTLSRNGWGKSLNFAGLSGNGVLKMTDPGSTTFDAVADFTGTLKTTGGTTTINGGTMDGAIEASGGTLNLNNVTQTSSLSVSGGSVNVEDATLKDVNISGGLTNVYGATVTGAVDIEGGLGAENTTFSGPVAVKSGILDLVGGSLAGKTTVTGGQLYAEAAATVADLTVGAEDAAKLVLTGRDGNNAQLEYATVETDGITSIADASALQTASIANAAIAVSADYSISDVKLLNSSLELTAGKLTLTGCTVEDLASVTLSGGSAKADAMSFGAGSTLAVKADSAVLETALTLSGATIDLGTHVDGAALSLGDNALTLGEKSTLVLDSSLVSGLLVPESIVLLSGVSAVEGLTSGAALTDYFTLGAGLESLANSTLVFNAGKLSIHTDFVSPDVFWVGDETGSGTWAVGGETVWDRTDGTTAGTVAYVQDANVTFSGDAAATITVDGAISAGHMVVEDGSYTFTGDAEDSVMVATLSVTDATMDASSLAVDLSGTDVTLAGSTLSLKGDVVMKTLSSEESTVKVEGSLKLNAATELGGFVEAEKLTLTAGNNVFQGLNVGTLESTTGALRIDNWALAGTNVIGKVTGETCDLTLAANQTLYLGNAEGETVLSALNLMAGANLLAKAEDDSAYYDLKVTGIVSSTPGRVGNVIEANNLTLEAGNSTMLGRLGEVIVHGDLALGGKSTSANKLTVAGDVSLLGASTSLDILDGSSIGGTVTSSIPGGAKMDLMTAGNVSIGAVDSTITVNKLVVAGSLSVGSGLVVGDLDGTGTSLVLKSGDEYHYFTVKGAATAANLAVEAGNASMGAASSLGSLTLHKGTLTLGGTLNVANALTGVHTVSVLSSANISGANSMVSVGGAFTPGAAGSLTFNVADAALLTSLNLMSGKSYTLLSAASGLDGFTATGENANLFLSVAGGAAGSSFENTADNKEYTISYVDGKGIVITAATIDTTQDVTWNGAGDGGGDNVWAGTTSPGDTPEQDKDNWQGGNPPVADTTVNFAGITDKGNQEEPATETITVTGTVQSGSIVVNSGQDTYEFSGEEGASIATGSISVATGTVNVAVGTEVATTTIVGSAAETEQAAYNLTEGDHSTKTMTVNENAAVSIASGATLKVTESLAANSGTNAVTLAGSLSVGETEDATVTNKGASIAVLEIQGSEAALTVAGDSQVSKLVSATENVEVTDLVVKSGTLGVTSGTHGDSVAITGLTVENLTLGTAGTEGTPGTDDTPAIPATPAVAGNLSWDKDLTVTNFANYGQLSMTNSSTLVLTTATEQGGAVQAGEVNLTDAAHSTFTSLTTNALTLNVGSWLTGDADAGYGLQNTDQALLTLTSPDGLALYDTLTKGGTKAAGGGLGEGDPVLQITLTGIDTVDQAAAFAAGDYVLVDADQIATWDVLDLAAKQQLFAQAGTYAVVTTDASGNLVLRVTADDPRVWDSSNPNYAGNPGNVGGNVLDLTKIAGVYNDYTTVDVVQISKSYELNLSGDNPERLEDENGKKLPLVLNHLTGGKYTLTLTGDADDHVVLNNVKETVGAVELGDSKLEGTLIVNGLTVDVTGDSASTLTVGTTQVDAGTLNVTDSGRYETTTTTLNGGTLSVADGGEYTTTTTTLAGGTLDVVDGGKYTTDTLSGTGTVSGTVTVNGAGGNYTGSYDEAEVLMGAGADQKLAVSEELTIGSALEGDETGKVTLVYNTNNADAKLAGISITTPTPGATVVLENVKDGEVKTLEVTNGSEMQGGTLAYGISAQQIADALKEGTAAPAIVSGKLDLNGTSIDVSQVDATTKRATFDVTKGTEGLTLYTLAGEESTIDVTLSELLPDSEFFNRYFDRNSITMENGVVKADLVTDYYTSQLEETDNGAAGLGMADTAFLELNPQDNRADYADLAEVMDALDAYTAPGADTKAADKLGAAVAGSGLASLGMALSGDVERQLKAIRNRTTTMGVDPAVVNADMPYFNAWINAEGDYREMDADSTMAGYDLSSWGGTVGFDMDVNPSLTWGLALTAMYGDFTADAADKVEGDVESYYVSAFARAMSGAWVHTFVATVGMNTTELTRTVSHSHGSYTTKGEAEGTSFGLLYEAARTYALNEDATACWQPVVNVAYRHIEVDGYTETGSDAALRVGDQSMDVVTFGLGARLQAIVGENLYNRTSVFEARALAKLDAGDRESELDTALISSQAATGTVKSAELDAFGVELGAGLTVPVGIDSGSIFVDGSVEFRGSYINGNATLGYRVNF